MTQVVIGIDPGSNGGTVILIDGHIRGAVKQSKKNENSTAEFLSAWARKVSPIRPDVYIERQLARPTRFKGGSSVLRSTVLLFGYYRLMVGMCKMIPCHIRHILPQRWQDLMGVKRRKGQTDSQWKSYLRDEARKLYPGGIDSNGRIPLWAADAVLI